MGKVEKSGGGGTSLMPGGHASNGRGHVSDAANLG